MGTTAAQEWRDEYASTLSSCRLIEKADTAASYSRARFYQLWDEYVIAQGGDDLSEVELTDEWWESITMQIGRESYRLFKSRLSRRRMREMLDWSPWVDEIAVDRAAQFDWAVIETLSPPERHALVARLYREGWQPPHYAPPGGELTPGVDARTIAWQSGPTQTRRNIVNRLSDYRRNPAVAA